ncbi:unnamed protein product [Penicillium pancosmium]
MAPVALEVPDIVYPSITVFKDTGRSEQYHDFRDELQQKGYAIIKNAIPRDRALQYKQKAFDWLNSFDTALDLNKPETWVAENLPVMNRVRMFHAYGVVHEKFMWEARMEPGVLDAFSKLWGTDELLVSFDCLNINLPNRPDLSARTPWQHIDQSPNKRGLHCVQGIINLCVSGPDDGGLVVYPGSHLLNDEFFDAHPNSAQQQYANDIYLFPIYELDWFEQRGIRPHKVCAEPGDLLLWDSRTVHYGSDSTEAGTRIRTAIYATYMPASLANADQLAKKKMVFEEFGSTSHWPYEHIEPDATKAKALLPDGSIDPRAEHRKVPLEKPEYCDKLLKLAGVLPY